MRLFVCVLFDIIVLLRNIIHRIKTMRNSIEQIVFFLRKSNTWLID